MMVPLFALAAADPAVTDVFGTNPVRIWPFDDAPDDPAAPYAVWQTVSGQADNYLDAPPDLDDMTIQVDVYAADDDEMRAGVTVLRDLVERHAQLTWRGDGRDRETRLYYTRFDVDWLVPR